MKDVCPAANVPQIESKERTLVLFRHVKMCKLTLFCLRESPKSSVTRNGDVYIGWAGLGRLGKRLAETTSPATTAADRQQLASKGTAGLRCTNTRDSAINCLFMMASNYGLSVTKPIINLYFDRKVRLFF